MLATSRMWRYTRWMRAVWWRLLRVGALAGKRRPGRRILFQTAPPHERLHCILASCSRPIRRWPCLTHSGLAEEAARAVEVAPAVGAEVERVEAAPEVGAEVERVEAAPAVGAEVERAVAAPEEEVKAAPVALEAAKVALAEARVAALAAVTTPLLTSTIRPSTSRGRSCRHSHHRLRPTSRS